MSECHQATMGTPWGGHKTQRRDDLCSTSVALTEIKTLCWVSRIFHSPGGPVLRCQNALQYWGEDESEQAVIFGQEAYPKFIYKRNTEVTITLMSK